MALFLNNLDDWLVAKLEGLTGVGTVTIGDTVNPDKQTPSGGVVRTLNGRLRQGQHGDGTVHHDVEYPVWLGIWATDINGIPAAKKKAAAFLPLLFGIIHDDELYEITGDSITGNGETEAVTEIATLGTWEIHLRDGGKQVGGIAVAIVNLTVTTGV